MAFFKIFKEAKAEKEQQKEMDRKLFGNTAKSATKETPETSRPAERKEDEFNVVCYYGENDPYGRPREWYTSEQGQKSLAYYRAQFDLPMYGRLITDLLRTPNGCVENMLKCYKARDKWPTAFFYYYLEAVNPEFRKYSPDLHFVILCIMLDKDASVEPFLYFAERFNPKVGKALHDFYSDMPYALTKIALYIALGAEKGIETYREPWLYDEKTYIDQRTGFLFSQDQILYAATLCAERPELFPDVASHVDNLPVYEKTAVTNNLM